MNFVPGAMGQNRFRLILSHCSRDKIGSMICSIVALLLWDNFVGQKGGAMTGFSGQAIKK